MKNLLAVSGVAALALWTQAAGAFTYADNDLLLVFRNGSQNDVEFNLGSVTNYLGKPDGTVITVTNFDANAVRTNFNNTLVGVKFILLSAANVNATAKNAYLTHADPTVPQPTDVTVSSWRSMQAKISFVGLQAQANTGTNATQKYIISPGDGTAYSFIASDGGANDASTVAGTAPFTVENAISNSASATVSKFFQVKGINPAGNPSIQIGSFAMGTNGVLTFTAGTGQTVLTPPAILGVTRNGNVTSVAVASTSGVNYRLRYTDSTGLATSVSTWPTLVSIPGTGATITLQDTSAVAGRFYKVEAF